MKILHTSDLHVGRQFNGLSLDDDHQAVLDQIMAAMLFHLPRVLIIAGDVFDRATPPATAVRQFNRFLRRVATETSAAVVMIAGNHDSGDRIGTMSVFTDERRVLVRGPLMAEETPLILEDDDGLVAFSALPFAYEYAARECFADEGISAPRDVLNAQLAAAKRYVPQGARWVVVAHAFVAGASGSEAERPLARVGGLETVEPQAFEGAHYVALGHLHRPQWIGSQNVRYSGAPLAFGFDEAGDEKSMCLIDLDASGAVKVMMLPFVPLRGVRTLRGKLSDLLEAGPSQDFIKAVLTDDVPLIDPMRQLREIFPNACQLIYARDEQTVLVQKPISFQSRLSDPLDVIGSFLEQVLGETMADAELNVVRTALDELREGGDVS